MGDIIQLGAKYGGVILARTGIHTSDSCVIARAGKACSAVSCFDHDSDQ
jgi:hypothetical protein